MHHQETFCLIRSDILASERNGTFDAGSLLAFTDVRCNPLTSPPTSNQTTINLFSFSPPSNCLHWCPLQLPTQLLFLASCKVLGSIEAKQFPTHDVTCWQILINPTSDRHFSCCTSLQCRMVSWKGKIE